MFAGIRHCIDSLGDMDDAGLSNSHQIIGQ